MPYFAAVRTSKIAPGAEPITGRANSCVDFVICALEAVLVVFCDVHEYFPVGLCLVPELRPQFSLEYLPLLVLEWRTPTGVIITFASFDPAAANSVLDALLHAAVALTADIAGIDDLVVGVVVAEVILDAVPNASLVLRLRHREQVRDAHTLLLQMENYCA